MNSSFPQLSPAAAERLEGWRNGGFLPAWAQTALDELIAAEAWEELEDRFFREITFGTGGMRGRVIGRRPAPVELGAGGPDAPAHPAIGANTLNDIVVARATMGLYRSVAVSGRTPRLVVAHDVRHFSCRFAELAAQVWNCLGGECWLFDGPRSTPQLSFTVRALAADGGIVLTASHNPPHDNGYKVYAAHGGQVVPPFANKIVEAVARVRPSEIGMVMAAAGDLGECWQTVPREMEEAYFAAAKQVVLDPELIKKQRPRVVFSALHGTGGVAVPRLLRDLGAETIEVAAQAAPDPRFPTVPSPNPEDPQALAETLRLSREQCADSGLATDPDADRIGTMFRDENNATRVLNGNALACVLTEYRLRRAKELGLIPTAGSPHVAVLKTFVTTPLLDAIAQGHGVRCVNTLTGFKWIGDKMRKYDEALKTRGLHAATQAGHVQNLLKHSTWVIFAGEESYGCTAGDAVRDKDANAAALMCAELAAWLRDKNQSVSELQNDIYVRHGYHREALRTLTFEGAAGAAQIQQVFKSLRSNPPATLGNRAVQSAADFGREDRRDEEGEVVPREELFLLYECGGGWRCAIRGSGTEPKVKFYFFARAPLAAAAARPALEAQLLPEFNRWMDAVVEETRGRAKG